MLQCILFVACINHYSVQALVLLHFLCRHEEVGPIYVMWILHNPLVISTDPDHVKVIVLTLMSVTVILFYCVIALHYMSYFNYPYYN